MAEDIAGVFAPDFEVELRAERPACGICVSTLAEDEHALLVADIIGQVVPFDGYGWHRSMVGRQK